MAVLSPSRRVLADVHRRRMVYSVGMPIERSSNGFGASSSVVLIVCCSPAVHLRFCASARFIQIASPEKADHILILKKDHLMELLAGGKVIRTYKVALGQGGLAPKQREGDARTPEGHYVDRRQV